MLFQGIGPSQHPELYRAQIRPAEKTGPAPASAVPDIPTDSFTPSTQAVSPTDETEKEGALPENPEEVRKAAEEQKKSTSQNPRDLTPEEQKIVQELKTRDREVRQHEQAHKAVGGRYVTGGPTYDYTTGPDNKRYAVGGEVQISTSPENTPEATIVKAQTVRRAALAPAQPSASDRATAATAGKMEIDARMQLQEEQREETEEAQEKNESQAAASTEESAQAAEPAPEGMDSRPGESPASDQAPLGPPPVSNGAEKNFPADTGQFLDLVV
jgi:hypothetical protein